jgi:hypothetical protein
MKFEISLIEVQEFLASCYDKKIGLKYIKEDTIEVNYYASILLTIKEVKADEIVFQYQMNGLVELLAEFLIGKKLDDSPIEWDSKSDEVIFYLSKVEALSNFLITFSIISVSFVDENLVLVLQAKSKNTNP